MSPGNGFRKYRSKSSQQKPTGPQKMADVLSVLMARRGYAQQQSAEISQYSWQQAVGKTFSGHSRAGNIRRGVLEVIVRNSAILQELTFQKKQLLKKMAEINGDQNISDLRFRVGVID